MHSASVSVDSVKKPMIRYTKRVVNRGLTVEVPAGRFGDCILFSVDGVSLSTYPITCGQTREPRSFLMSGTMYYCPGLGNVKESSYERYGTPGRPDPACDVHHSERVLKSISKSKP
jgi:hypothetical protein